MDDEYHPPIFLTGNLPKRDSTQIIWLMLCLKRLNIKLPKDIYRMIYEEFYPIRLDKFELHLKYIVNHALHIDSDFVVIRPKLPGTIDFSHGLSYSISVGNTYLLCPQLLRGVYMTEVKCERVSIEYWSFIDQTSPLSLSFYGLAHALNSDIDGLTLMYTSGTVRQARGKLVRSSKILYPKTQEYIDECLKHGLICLVDPLSRQVTGYINNEGKGIVM